VVGISRSTVSVAPSRTSIRVEPADAPVTVKEDPLLATDADYLLMTVQAFELAGAFRPASTRRARSRLALESS
jgi:hypothetical protein